MISRSSTSDGSNSVFSASSESCGATSCISKSRTPSSDQPCERATATISVRVSERLTYIPVSPARRPSSRNCSPSVVFPEPGSPWIR